ncbi:Testis-expressed sequence protein [Trichinella spiralis]|uniref:Testis-expressed sequence protein n=1 Tax=Trichinella spiralis TaxID=6334 RepID=A0A0V1BPI2_TRISP|nr:Testis-expressed sequence protein [Trichinella spiralis]
MDAVVILFLIAFFISLLALTVLILLVHSGLLFEPVVSEGEPHLCAEAKIVYKIVEEEHSSENLGYYFNEITSIITKAYPMAIFLECPTGTGKFSKCAVGCIISLKHADEEESEMLVTYDELKLLFDKGYVPFVLPRIERGLVSWFPYRTPFSIWFASRRVYKKMNSFIEQGNIKPFPFLEFYKDCKIYYFAPLEKQEQCLLNEFTQTYSDVENKPPVTEETHIKH